MSGGAKGSKKTQASASQPTLRSSLRSSLARSRHDEFTSEAEAGRFSRDVNSTIDHLRATLLKEIQSLQDDFNQAIEDLKLTISDLADENEVLKEKCNSLEERVNSLEKEKDHHAALINKQERFSRRNNVRIVGFPTTDKEDCIGNATKVFEEVGFPSVKIERAHRDGKIVNGRDRHLLVKLSFYQDKVSILSNARQALASKDYYIVEDLTATDLKEKKKWGPKVQELFRNGVRLKFSGGLWRGNGGKPYRFD
ncbi:LINE-1 retrotransposable element ORF1 protein [Holothuria leucospilota]|uniref:LINE-1 retrotransposable element ORF1 protein n=1 Tax=Holothuria leucospilota TaxID=206669 RepID=A0A9Q1CGQ8_HOLLE|nr:LINE-1 retrotransposable element ORF1 protein [Holothuria leucospilota]